MNYDLTDPPTSIEDDHELSTHLGKAYAISYRIDPCSKRTDELLESYKDSRRQIPIHESGSRYGCYKAYEATQDMTV